jgi:hypothetical protein
MTTRIGSVAVCGAGGGYVQRTEEEGVDAGHRAGGFEDRRGCLLEEAAIDRGISFVFF